MNEILPSHRIDRIWMENYRLVWECADTSYHPIYRASILILTFSSTTSADAGGGKVLPTNIVGRRNLILQYPKHLNSNEGLTIVLYPQ